MSILTVMTFTFFLYSQLDLTAGQEKPLLFCHVCINDLTPQTTDIQQSDNKWACKWTRELAHELTWTHPIQRGDIRGTWACFDLDTGLGLTSSDLETCVEQHFACILYSVYILYTVLCFNKATHTTWSIQCSVSGTLITLVATAGILNLIQSPKRPVKSKQ